MKIISKQAVQVHEVPDHITAPRGPFPAELLREPEIIYDYKEAAPDNGDDYLPGATAQNNYKPVRHLRCGACFARVLETETESHVCEE